MIIGFQKKYNTKAVADIYIAINNQLSREIIRKTNCRNGFQAG